MEKTYEGFLNIFKHREIKKLCKEYEIYRYEINDDESIDIQESFSLRRKSKSLTKPHLPLKFRNATYNFFIDNNALITLEGCPINIGDNFICRSNKLTSLEYGPKIVGGYYDCSDNQLTSLAGCAQNIGGGFINFSGNDITSFDGFPINFTGVINSNSNPVGSLWQLFHDVTKIELFNDYDIVRDDTIVMDRLIDFLFQIRPNHWRSENILRVINGYLTYSCKNFKYKFI